MYQRMRVRDHLTYYGRLGGRTAAEATADADEWLERLGLADRADDLVQSLSSGNQQRVQLALALLGRSELLVLDEPFSGLDPIAVEVLGEILRAEVARGAALLLSSHQLDLVADVAADVVIVDHGRVVLQGEVADLRAGSHVRLVEVDFAEPAAWGGDGPSRHHRREVDLDADPAELLADARRHGDVVAFSLAPPDLSEVFREAVRRTEAAP
jgi:ABC-2 type transport system ATP-binding protein